MKDQVAEIVSSYVRHHTIAPDQLPTLIATVNEALSGLGKAPEPAPATAPTPAVPIRRSVGEDKITCLTCGWAGKMLKRHLTTHEMTPEQYRARWNLPVDYPMVAKNYAARRSQLAKSFGLGKRRG